MSTTISQRELRNGSGEIMRRLQAGESFTITSNGVPVGSLTPMSQPTRLPITRPATRRGFDGFPLHPTPMQSTAALLDDLRDDRRR